LEIKTIEQSEYTTAYLTATPELSSGEQAAMVFAQVAKQLVRQGIQPISEKIYGRRSRTDDLLRQRHAAYEAAGIATDLPFTFLEGKPFHDGDLAGVQIWGIIPRASQHRMVESFSFGANQSGRVFTCGDCRLFYFPAFRGFDENGTLPDDRQVQAANLFEAAVAALSAQGLIYRQVVRTWIYLAHLLAWYVPFNDIRTARYRREGIGPEPAMAPYPASTGIQGQSGAEECLMDVLALQETGAGASRRAIQNSARQNQSMRYGSSFSRGMAVTSGGRKTVYISGTASIDPAGKSAHVGNAELQALETLLCLAAILKDEGGDLSHIVQATCFCKTPEAYLAFRNAADLLKIPAFPAVPVQADVCREDLLIEIEATAMI
jgi:enamine deaminase RidA (YjgF/YER057c/UK114 family)